MKKYIVLPTSAGQTRFADHKIDEIIIHGMSEYHDYNGKHMHAVELLNELKFSCHYMIDPTGEVIECADPLRQTCWHAKGHNTHSIGIEILLKGLNSYGDFIHTMKEVDWIRAAQETTLQELCVDLMEQHKMNKNAKEHVKMHKDIDPSRKVDPGFKHNWQYFYQLLNK